MSKKTFTFDFAAEKISADYEFIDIKFPFETTEEDDQKFMARLLNRLSYSGANWSLGKTESDNTLSKCTKISGFRTKTANKIYSNYEVTHDYFKKNTYNPSQQYTLSFNGFSDIEIIDLEALQLQYRDFTFLVTFPDEKTFEERKEYLAFFDKTWHSREHVNSRFKIPNFDLESDYKSWIFSMILSTFYLIESNIDFVFNLMAEREDLHEDVNNTVFQNFIKRITYDNVNFFTRGNLSTKDTYLIRNKYNQLGNAYLEQKSGQLYKIETKNVSIFDLKKIYKRSSVARNVTQFVKSITAPPEEKTYTDLKAFNGTYSADIAMHRKNDALYQYLKKLDAKPNSDSLLGKANRIKSKHYTPAMVASGVYGTFHFSLGKRTITLSPGPFKNFINLQAYVQMGNLSTFHLMFRHLNTEYSTSLQNVNFFIRDRIQFFQSREMLDLAFSNYKATSPTTSEMSCNIFIIQMALLNIKNYNRRDKLSRFNQTISKLRVLDVKQILDSPLKINTAAIFALTYGEIFYKNIDFQMKNWASTSLILNLYSFYSEPNPQKRNKIRNTKIFSPRDNLFSGIFFSLDEEFSKELRQILETS